MPFSDPATSFDKQHSTSSASPPPSSARLANPLAGIPRATLTANAAVFAHEHGLGHLDDLFAKGALVAQDPEQFESIDELTEEDRAVLRREVTHRWDHPKELYWLVIMCSLAAAVQGVRLTLHLPGSC